VIEKLTGQTWDKALRQRLIDPLGLRHTVTLPEEAILLSAAVGHQAPAGEEPRPVTTFLLPRSIGPAGLITASTADVLAFARLHLTRGLGPQDNRLLSEDSATAMTERHADVPNKHAFGDSWGLGWMRFDWDGRLVIGHDGGTVGQFAYLRIVPELDLAVTCSPTAAALWTSTRSCSGPVRRNRRYCLAPPVSPPAQPIDVDAAPYIGAYERPAAASRSSRATRVCVSAPS